MFTEGGAARAPTVEAVAGHPESFFGIALAKADPSALSDLCARYIELARSHVETGQNSDEALMRAIERTVDVTEQGKEVFRKGIVNYIGALSIEGRPFEYGTSAKLHRALAAYLHQQGSTDN